MSNEPGLTNRDKPDVVEVLAIIGIQLERIADTLEHVAKANDSKDVTPIAEDDSIGACPQCESVDVKQDGELPKAIFKCNNCNLVWMGNANDYFGA